MEVLATISNWLHRMVFLVKGQYPTLLHRITDYQLVSHPSAIVAFLSHMLVGGARRGSPYAAQPGRVYEGATTALDGGDGETSHCTTLYLSYPSIGIGHDPR